MQMHVIREHQLLPDRGRDFRVTTHSPAGLNDELPPYRAILAPGWIGGRATFAPLADDLVRASRGQMDVVTYDLPLVGRSAYAQDYRTERFAHVAGHFSGWNRLVGVGHSCGWLSVAEAGPGLAAHDDLQAAAGLTPMGLYPMKHYSHGRMLAAVGREAALSLSAVSDRRSIATGGRIVARTALHWLAGRGRAAEEVTHAFRSDLLAKTVDLSRRLPTVLIASERDRVGLPVSILPALESTGYVGSRAILPGTHIAGLTDARRVPAIYAALEMVLRPGRQG